MTRYVKQPKYKPRKQLNASQRKTKRKIQKFFPPRIENVAAQAYLGCEIDLEAANQVLMGVYDLKIFPDCVVRCYEPRSTQSTFKSGKMVSAGAKSEGACLLAMYKKADMLYRTLRLDDIMIYNFKVENLVATFCTGYRIDLNLFYEDNFLNTDYDPEDIKCARYSVSNPSASFGIYDTGAVVLCGCNNVTDLFKVYSELDLSRYRLDKAYRKVDEARKRTREQTHVNFMLPGDQRKSIPEHRCQSCSECVAAPFPFANTAPDV